MSQKIRRGLSLVLSLVMFISTLFVEQGVWAAQVPQSQVDLTLEAPAKTVFSGETASYILNFKVAGALEEVNESLAQSGGRLVIQLPNHTHYRLQSTLEELKVVSLDAEGNEIVTLPVYDENQHQLIYDFTDLRTGISSEMTLKLITDNGITPDETQLPVSASFSSADYNVASAPATVLVRSKTNATITKEALTFKETDKAYGYDQETARWKLKLTFPTSDKGIQIIQPESDIIITDELDEKLSFVAAMGEGVTSSVNGNQVKLVVKAPSQEEQLANIANGLPLLTKEVILETRATWTDTQPGKIPNKANLAYTNQDGVTNQVDSNVANVAMATHFPPSENTSGTYYYGYHYGPKKDKPSEAIYDVNNPNPSPVVKAGDIVQFNDNRNIAPGRYWDNRTNNFIPGQVIDEIVTGTRNGISVPYEIKRIVSTGYKHVSFEYEADNHLQLEHIIIGRPTLQYKSSEPVMQMTYLPHIRASVKLSDGRIIEREIGNNYSSYTYISRADLGLKETEQVKEVKIEYYNPNGEKIDGRAKFNHYFNYSVKNDGYEGLAYHKLIQSTYALADDETVYVRRPNLAETRTTTTGERSVQIIVPAEYKPTIVNDVIFKNRVGSLIKQGSNQVRFTATNTVNSLGIVEKTISGMVLLPKGVVFNQENPKVQYYVGRTPYQADQIGGSYEIIDNFEGTGQQLVILKMANRDLRVGESWHVDFDVTIQPEAPKNLVMLAYTTVGNRNGFEVGSASSNLKKEEDTNDIDQNERTLERLTSLKTYTLDKNTRLNAIKLVKGSRDKNFTLFGHTELGKDIEYKIRLDNVTGSVISRLGLIDILPNQGDMTVLNGKDRLSQFTPKLKGKVILPDEWVDKVEVLYSQVNNPERDDLLGKVTYPVGAYLHTNPQGVQSPAWMKEDQVTDWSSIKSFKLELINGASLPNGGHIDIYFTMVAPTQAESRLLDKSIPERERAAWNSFAVTIDGLLPTEPERVGVVLEYIPDQSIRIVKIEQGNENKKLANAGFRLFGEDGQTPIGDVQRTNANGEVIFENLVVGRTYYLQEVSAPQHYTSNGTKYQLAIREDGVQILNQDNQVHSLSTTDNVTVVKIQNSPILPPSEEPSVTKKINGNLDHLDIAPEADYTYNIVSKLPRDITKYEKYELVDTLDERLELKEGSRPRIVGEASAYFDVEVEGQTVRAKMKDFANAESLAGKQVELVIEARIKAGVVEANIPNTVTLSYGHTPGAYGEKTPKPGEKTPPPVTVTPPQKPPMPKKPKLDKPRKSPKTGDFQSQAMMYSMGILVGAYVLIRFRKKEQDI